MPTIFLFLFSRLLTYTNPSALMDDRQWVEALLLFLLFGLCVFYTHHTTQKNYLYHLFIHLFNKYLEGINTSVTIVTAISVSPG